MSNAITMPADFSLEKVNFDQTTGLLPAIVQDAGTKVVLMLGYQNTEALRRTLANGEVWFFSRSRQTLWRKGETSGNVLRVCALQWDCDQDALLYQAEPAGPTCHTGEISCFGEGEFSFKKLEKIIHARLSEEGEAQSYTRQLFEDINLNLAKITEEAAEVVQAIEQQEGNNRLANEAADVIYHLMVLLAGQGVSLADVEKVLGERNGA